MATTSRWEIGAALNLLDTFDAAVKNSKQNPEHLIILLFNVQFPGRGSIESRLKSWWHDYEKKHHAKFYKYIVAKGKQDIKTQFKIERLPTIIFMRNGEEIERIDHFDESNPDITDQATTGGQSNDDKLLKKKLDELDKNARSERV